ncbi:MAG: flagellar assembly protein FliW [Acidobacteriota bacterium]|nr:flagellar assembly protein FliW [Acidobacteriota bacterium]
MPTLITKHFGAVDYEEAEVIQFPSGLPGFENQHSFLFLDRPGAAPVLFLQSVSQQDLRLPAVPVHAVDPVYRLAVNEDDLATLGLPGGRQPSIGSEVMCLAVVAATPNGVATFNLLAPIVVNVKTRQALQAIRVDSAYSHEHCLGPSETCS